MIHGVQSNELRVLLLGIALFCSTMKVENNTVLALKDFFFKELVPLVGEGETQQFFRMACEHYLGFDYRKQIPLQFRVSESEMLVFFGLIKRLKKAEPIQYIIGGSHFCDLYFTVGPQVLIPRPETEELVHWVLKDNPDALKIVDLCTGSGCIPICLRKKYPEAQITAFELSEEAIGIATINAKKLGLPVNFVQQDVLTMLPEMMGYGIDIITANPPYILPGDSALMEANVLNYEPHLALFAPVNDLFAFYQRIASLANDCLRIGGQVYVEIHPDNSTEVSELFSTAGLIDVQVKNDISDKPRIVRGTKK